MKVPLPLYDVLELDEERMTVRVEPMVTVGDITRYLVPRGYTLAVTLEIADATLGGLAFGVGMTTYSHKVGLYQETIEEYEVVLGDGSLVRATRDNQHSDLYHCLAWSHGSLAFLVGLTLKIVPVKPYIHMRYIPVRGQKRYCDKIRELSGALDKDAQVPDYVEATVYNKEEAVIMVGNFADVETPEQRAKVNNVTRWYKPWFYKHVETFLETGEGEEYIPLREYLLRHDKAIFWVLESMIPFGNHPLFLFFLGWMLPPKPAFMKLTTTPTVRAMTFTKQVFQDIVLPINRLEDQINISHQLFDTYPVLVYPCRIYDHGKHVGQLRPPRQDQMVPGANYGMFNDLGVYGVPRLVRERKPWDAVTAMRKMESFTRSDTAASRDLLPLHEVFVFLLGLFIKSFEDLSKKHFKHLTLTFTFLVGRSICDLCCSGLWAATTSCTRTPSSPGRSLRRCLISRRMKWSARSTWLKVLTVNVNK